MAGYDQSRRNATKWGTCVEGPITCRPKCPYKRYHEQECCPHGTQPLGQPCTIEVAYADEFAESIRRQYGRLIPRTRREEFDHLVDQATKAALLRERINCRWNDAWDIDPDSPARWREFALSSRYWTRAHNQYCDSMNSMYAMAGEARTAARVAKAAPVTL